MTDWLMDQNALLVTWVGILRLREHPIQYGRKFTDRLQKIGEFLRSPNSSPSILAQTLTTIAPINKDNINTAYMQIESTNINLFLNPRCMTYVNFYFILKLNESSPINPPGIYSVQVETFQRMFISFQFPSDTSLFPCNTNIS